MRVRNDKNLLRFLTTQYILYIMRVPHDSTSSFLFKHFGQRLNRRNSIGTIRENQNTILKIIN